MLGQAESARGESVRKLLEIAAAADKRCTVALVYTAALLTAFEYELIPVRVEARLRGLDASFAPSPSLQAGLVWVLACVLGYLVVPLLFVKLFHREPASTVGFRIRGFHRHVGVYLLLFALMLPVVIAASREPSFQTAYPFVVDARESVGDFLCWEAAYVAQFVALEAFFRGYLLFTLESRFGATAVPMMAVPYAMIHFHKPAPEAFGAIVAGLVLGFLALRFRSWVGGALLHALVAVTMDVLAVRQAGLF